MIKNNYIYSMSKTKKLILQVNKMKDKIHTKTMNKNNTMDDFDERINQMVNLLTECKSKKKKCKCSYEMSFDSNGVENFIFNCGDEKNSTKNIHKTFIFGKKYENK